MKYKYLLPKGSSVEVWYWNPKNYTNRLIAALPTEQDWFYETYAELQRDIKGIAYMVYDIFVLYANPKDVIKLP